MLQDLIETTEAGFVIYGVIWTAVLILFFWYKIQDAKETKNQDSKKDGPDSGQ